MGEGDVMGTYLSRPDEYEIEVRKTIEQRVRPGMNVAVIGAHWGTFVHYCLQLGAKVWAFEPDPDNFAELKERCPMATVFNMAGLDRDATLPFYRDEGNSGNHTLFAHGAIGLTDKPTIDVECHRLEAYVPDLDFVLIDAQGVDHLAFEGLGDHRPPVAVVEHWDHGLTCSGIDPDSVLRGYEALGYALTKLDDLNYLLVKG